MSYLSTGIWSSFVASLWFGAIVVVCGRVGGAMLARTGFCGTKLSGLELNLFSLAIGFIILSLATLTLGLFDFL